MRGRASGLGELGAGSEHLSADGTRTKSPMELQFERRARRERHTVQMTPARRRACSPAGVVVRRGVVSFALSSLLSLPGWPVSHHAESNV